MSKFRLKLKLTGLEVEVEGDREFAPQIADNIGRQISQVIQPAALIEGHKETTTIIVDDAGNATRGPRRRRTSTRSAPTGGNADNSETNWNHDAGQWGTPRQEWKSFQKVAWMFYVMEQATGQKPELGTGKVSNAFNNKFRSAGVVHQGSLARDLKAQPDYFGEIEGKWFLKDRGRQMVVEKLLPEALGKVASTSE